MKYFYSIILLIVAPFVGHSQSVISNVVPGFGDQFVLSVAEVAPAPGPAGANLIWDFSNEIIAEDVAHFTVMSPGEVAGSADFPDATMVWATNLEDMDLASYVGFDNNTFTEYGSKTEASGLSFGTYYSDPIDRFTYPLAYQNIGGDSYGGIVFGIGAGNSISGTESYVVDGWGTIITPYGTYENVLRVTHTGEETLDAILTSVTNRTETMWFSPAYPMPVMVIASYHSYTMGIPSDSSQTMTALVSYTPASTTGLADLDNPNTFSVYPNPASDYISLIFNNAKATTVLNIYSAAGKLVDTKTDIQSNQNVDVSRLVPGIYIAVLYIDGQRYAQKPFSVSK